MLLTPRGASRAERSVSGKEEGEGGKEGARALPTKHFDSCFPLFVRNRELLPEGSKRESKLSSSRRERYTERAQGGEKEATHSKEVEVGREEKGGGEASKGRTGTRTTREVEEEEEDFESRVEEEKEDRSCVRPKEVYKEEREERSEGGEREREGVSSP